MCKFVSQTKLVISNTTCCTFCTLNKTKRDNLQINTLDIVHQVYMTTVVKKRKKISWGTLLGLLLQQPTIH